ncbi:hypothetical protein OKW44_001895 [Paraburkholderia sp. WSM4174]
MPSRQGLYSNLAFRLIARYGASTDHSVDYLRQDRSKGVCHEMSHSCMVGAAGYAGDGGLAVHAMLSGPRGLAFGRDGALYVADGFRIRKITGLPGRHRWDCRDKRRYGLDGNDGDED